MKFWVKRYEDGEVSRWLCARSVGEKLEIRGPVPTWSGHVDDWDEIVLISGGTGITPFYQLLYKLFRDPVNAHLLKTHVTLLHSSPTSSTLPPSSMLEQLARWARLHPQAFTLELFVDSKDHERHIALYPSLKERRIGRKDIEQCLRDRRLSYPAERRGSWPWQARTVPKRVLFLVCGPDAMINALAGPKALDPSQSHVGGALAELGYGNEHVCKF